RFSRDWSSDVCSSDLVDRRQVRPGGVVGPGAGGGVLPGPQVIDRLLRHLGGELAVLLVDGEGGGRGEQGECAQENADHRMAPCRSEERRVGKAGTSRW